MEWQVILALVLGLPIILFPAAYVWYMNTGAILAELQARRKTVREKPAEQHAVAK